MRVRWIGLALALELLGLAAGYAAGSDADSGPEDLGAAAPIAAVEPTWPGEPPKIEPDSTFPALAPGTKTHPETVGSAPFALRLPVPNGWVRTNSAAGEWKWHPSKDFELNTYFLRVGQVGAGHQPVAKALSSRIAALDGAESVKDFDLETQTTDSFTATYVSEEHRRLAMERYLPGPDGNAMVWIALIGRVADRAGMAELFPRITNGVSVG